MTLALAAIALVYVGIYSALSAVHLVLPTLAGVVVGVLSLKLLAIAKTSVWPGQIICAILTGLTFWISLHTGGALSTAAVWLVVAPVIAVVFRRGAKSVFFWTAVAAICFAGLLAVPESAIQSRDILLGSWHAEGYSLIVVMGLMAFLLAVLWLRGQMQRWLLDEMNRTEAAKHRAEKQLHEKSREKLRETLQAIMDRSPVGIVISNRDRLLYANPAFCEMTGYEADEFLELDLPELLPPDNVDEHRHRLSLLDERDFLQISELELLRKDGSILPATSDVFWADLDGDSVLISIVRDLSEHRELQAKMMQLDRMAAVGNLAAGVAHEVNNPLSFIQSNLEFIVRQLPEDSPDSGEFFASTTTGEIREAVTDSLEGTRRIRETVDDLRRMSPRDELELEPIQLADVIESAIRMASNQIQQKARLVRDIDELPMIESDESHLAQIFMNLLINAAQAIPEGDVEGNEIRIEVTERSDRIFVAISDTGEGISEELIDDIFEPFVSTKPQGEGMGLGLSICRNRIQQLGGTIDVESTVGEGTTFRIELPKRTTDEDSMEFEVRTEPVDESGETIVIIDDEPAVLRGQKRQLGSIFEVKTYVDACNALDELGDDSPPRLILCDVQMPAMSGGDFFRRLRREAGEEWTERLVFITGGAFTRDAREFLEKTDRPVLDKPFGLEEILELVDDHDE